MKILNPNHVPAASAKQSTLKTKLAAWFVANASKDGISLAELAVEVPESVGMKQGEIHQAAKDAGWIVRFDGE